MLRLRNDWLLALDQHMGLYRCHFSRNGIRFDDAHGFEANGHDEAMEITMAICAILLDRDPEAAEAMVELVAHSGETVLTSSVGALVNDLQ